MLASRDFFARYFDAVRRPRDDQAPGRRFSAADFARIYGVSVQQAYHWRAGMSKVPPSVVIDMARKIGDSPLPWWLALQAQWAKAPADQQALLAMLEMAGGLPVARVPGALVVGPAFSVGMAAELIAQQAQADSQRAHDAGEALRQSKAEAKRPRPGESLDELRERYAAIDGCATLDELAALDAISPETGDMRAGQGEG